MIGGVPYAIPWLGDWHVIRGITPPQTGFIEQEPGVNNYIELEASDPNAPGLLKIE